MQGSDLVALLGVCLIVGAGVFGMLAHVALTEGRAMLAKQMKDVQEATANLEAKRAVRDRHEQGLKAAEETMRDLEIALDAANTELKEMEARPPTRIHVLSRRAEPGLPIYMAPVTALRGFPDSGAVGQQERNYAAPAENEAAFRQELAERFPPEQDFGIGAVTLFAPPESTAAAARQVA